MELIEMFSLSFEKRTFGKYIRTRLNIFNTKIQIFFYFEVCEVLCSGNTKMSFEMHNLSLWVTEITFQYAS